MLARKTVRPRRARQLQRQIRRPQRRESHLKNTTFDQHNRIVILRVIQQLDPPQRLQGIQVLRFNQPFPDTLAGGVEPGDPIVGIDRHKSVAKLSDTGRSTKRRNLFFGGGGNDATESGVTITSPSSPMTTVLPFEGNLEGEERDAREVLRELARRRFLQHMRFSAIPTAIVATQVIATASPNGHKNRDSAEAMAAPMAKVRRSSGPFIARNKIGAYSNLHQRTTCPQEQY